MRFKTLKTISKILNGEEVSNENFSNDLNISDLAHFQFAQITSVNVERSFFDIQELLSDNRGSFNLGSIKQTFIVQ